MEIDVREMKIDDLAPVFHLGEELFTSERHSNLYRTWDEYEVTRMFISEPELCLVACADEMLAGFVLGTTIEKARTAWNYGHLLWLGVDGRFQRQGIAKRLFDAFRKAVEELGVRILIVDTQADNENALAFFRSQGFDQTTEHVYLSMNLENQSKQNDEGKRDTRSISI